MLPPSTQTLVVDIWNNNNQLKINQTEAQNYPIGASILVACQVDYTLRGTKITLISSIVVNTWKSDSSITNKIYLNSYFYLGRKWLVCQQDGTWSAAVGRCIQNGNWSEQQQFSAGIIIKPHLQDFLKWLILKFKLGNIRRLQKFEKKNNGRELWSLLRSGGF